MADTTAQFTANGKDYKLNVGLFIGNKFVPSISGKKFETVNPADGKVIVSVYEGVKRFHEVSSAPVHRSFLTVSRCGGRGCGRGCREGGFQDLETHQACRAVC